MRPGEVQGALWWDDRGLTVPGPDSRDEPWMYGRRDDDEGEGNA